MSPYETFIPFFSLRKERELSYIKTINTYTLHTWQRLSEMRIFSIPFWKVVDTKENSYESLLEKSFCLQNSQLFRR